MGSQYRYGVLDTKENEGATTNVEMHHRRLAFALPP